MSSHQPWQLYKKRPPAEARALQCSIDWEALEVDLEAGLHGVDAIFALVDRLGRARLDGRGDGPPSIEACE